MPMLFWKWKLAFQTGWTLEYIDNLPYGRLVEFLQITDATNKAKQ